jgi:hypothetical protein
LGCLPFFFLIFVSPDKFTAVVVDDDIVETYPSVGEPTFVDMADCCRNFSEEMFYIAYFVLSDFLLLQQFSKVWPS